MKIDFRVESCLRYLAQKSGLDTTPRFLVKFFCTRTTIRVQSRGDYVRAFQRTARSWHVARNLRAARGNTRRILARSRKFLGEKFP